MHLYLIRGLPGSGKSTLSNSLLEAGLVDHVFEADMYMVDKKGNYNFDPSRLKECHSTCFENTSVVLSSGKNVAVSNTFVKLWELDKYEDMAKSLGAKVTILRCEKNFGNVHNVPHEVVARMYHTFEDY